MKDLSVVLILALMPACGVTRNRAIGSDPDGAIAQVIDCRRNHPGKCVQRSQQLCEPFAREPKVIRPLVFNEWEERWTMVVTCGPPAARPASPAPPEVSGNRSLPAPTPPSSSLTE
jgi:hypothetical protein